MKHSASRSRESIEFARSQRRTAKEFANTEWQWIRNRQIDGAKFRREYPIPPYTVDFCCVERKLVIEVDGEAHFSEPGQKHDRLRDRYLSELGFMVLRIPGYELIRDGGKVMEKIRTFVCDEANSRDPSPPNLRHGGLTASPRNGARGVRI